MFTSSLSKNIIPLSGYTLHEVPFFFNAVTYFPLTVDTIVLTTVREAEKWTVCWQWLRSHHIKSCSKYFSFLQGLEQSWLINNA
jgi:hypothetical protein